MQIPETSNPHFQHAFKKGYRMALEGKSVDSMPSAFRRDMELRQYFQEGWEQAVEDAKLAQAQNKKPDWKHRFIWFALMVLGGIATALHIISLYESEQQTLQQQLNQPPSKLEHSADAISQSNSMRLLSDAAKQDIELNKKEAEEFLALEPLELEPIIESSITVQNAQISEMVENRQAINRLGTDIPKNIRQLYFFTEIKGGNKQTIYHRWRTDTQILATIELAINSDLYRTWSNKKLSSAWQGQWYVEVLDAEKNVIYRQAFTYGN